MGSKDLRDTFNEAVAASGAICTSARMQTVRHEGLEYARLSFHGKRANGDEFEYVKLVPGSVDVLKAARDAAAEFIGASP